MLKAMEDSLWRTRRTLRSENGGAKPCRCWEPLDCCPWLAAHPRRPNRQQISRCKAAQRLMRLFSVRRKSLTSTWERSTSSTRKIPHPNSAKTCDLRQDAAAAAAEEAAAVPEAAAAEAAAAPEAAGEVAAGEVADAGAAAAAVAVYHGAAAATARPQLRRPTSRPNRILGGRRQRKSPVTGNLAPRPV